MRSLFCFVFIGLALWQAQAVEGLKEVNCTFANEYRLDYVERTAKSFGIIEFSNEFPKGETFSGLTCMVQNQAITDDEFQVSSRNSLVNVFVIKNNKNVEYLPSNLAECFPDLGVLDVHHTSLKLNDNQTFTNLTKLVIVYLDNNDIENINGNAFTRMHKLVILSLNHNKIKSLAEKIFSTLKNLSMLNLAGNQIVELPENIFQPLHKLEFLILSDNNIQILNENIFSKLTKVGLLFLSGNQLEEIEDDLFANNVELDMIFLQNNKINFINYRMFSKLSELELINLHNNSCIDAGFGTCPEQKFGPSFCKAYNASIEALESTLKVSCPPYEYDTKAYLKTVVQQCYANQTALSKAPELKSVFDSIYFKLFFGVWVWE